MTAISQIHSLVPKVQIPSPYSKSPDGTAKLINIPYLPLSGSPTLLEKAKVALIERGNEACPIENMPDEILLHIFCSYITKPEDLKNASEVCKVFYRVSKSEILWKNALHFLLPNVHALPDDQTSFTPEMQLKIAYKALVWISQKTVKAESDCNELSGLVDRVRRDYDATLQLVPLCSDNLTDADTVMRISKNKATSLVNAFQDSDKLARALVLAWQYKYSDLKQSLNILEAKIKVLNERPSKFNNQENFIEVIKYIENFYAEAFYEFNVYSASLSPSEPVDRVRENIQWWDNCLESVVKKVNNCGYTCLVNFLSWRYPHNEQLQYSRKRANTLALNAIRNFWASEKDIVKGLGLMAFGIVCYAILPPFTISDMIEYVTK